MIYNAAFAIVYKISASKHVGNWFSELYQDCHETVASLEIQFSSVTFVTDVEKILVELPLEEKENKKEGEIL